MSVAAIILAAGRARRFGAGSDESKVLAQIDGVSLLARVAKGAAGSRASPVIAVVGHAFAKVEAELQGYGFDVVRNQNLDLGLSHSLRLGLAAVPVTASAAIIMLADMPYVSAEIIDALVLGFEAADPAPAAVVPVYRGARGNPVLLSRAIFEDVAHGATEHTVHYTKFAGDDVPLQRLGPVLIAKEPTLCVVSPYREFFGRYGIGSEADTL